MTATRRSSSASCALLVGAALFACACAPERPLSLLLISVDTLRADRLGCYGNPLGLTPELDALAERSAVFAAAFAPTSFTRPSVAALLSGRYPEETGVHSNLAPFPESVPTLATALRARGYRTGAVVSNAILGADAGLTRGFDHYDDRLEERERSRPLPERTAARTTQAALEWLRAAAGEAKPFFLWVHYQDPHGPYTPPEAYRSADRDAERWPGDPASLPLGTNNSGLRALPPYQAIDDEREPAFYRARYNGEVRYADAAIGELLRGADASADRDRLVIAFTADHGEALGEGGMWFAHASALVDPLVRVPLLLAIPGRAPERRSDTASLVDLVPTLLAALGVEPPGELPGRDLLAPGAASAERPAYFHALEPIPGQWIEHWGAARGDARFYRIDKQGRRSDHARRAGADVSPDAAEIAALRGGAESLRAEIRARAIPAAARAAHPPSASERERLEALGYLDPAAD